MGIETRTVNRFRGLNSWLTLARVSPDQAVDCMNVIPSSDGGLDKMRVPVTVSDIRPAVTGPARLFDYLTSTAMVAQFGTKLYSYAIAAGGAMTGTVVPGLQPTVPASFSMVEMNHVVYMANGTDMLGIVSGTLQPWGFQAPNPPEDFDSAGVVTGFGNCRQIATITSNVGGTIFLGVVFGLFVAVGDMVKLSGVTTTAGVGSFNAEFPVTAVNADLTAIQLGGGPVSCNGAGGKAFAPTFYTHIPITAAERIAGATKFTLGISPTNHPFQPLDYIVISGMADSSFNGEYHPAIGALPDLWINQPGLPDATAIIGGGEFVDTPLTIGIGLSYKQSQWDASTLHYGPVSTAYTIAPPGGGGSRMVVLAVPVTPPPDGNVGSALFRTIDGGGDYYALDTPLTAFSSLIIFRDTSGDSGNEDLNLEVQAPTLNFAPPAGYYTAKYQGRTYIFRLASDSMGVAYSGYELILLGRPERSFPPQNRLRLALGADPIAGGGVIQSGVIAFSTSDRMYMQRGLIEDISVTTPVQFTSYLEELPWNIGCAGHESIVSTPYGLVWLTGDLTVNLFDGSNKPMDISGQALPIFRSITASAKGNADAVFFNWLDREWYVITMPVEGSLTNNRIVFIDLNPEPEANVGVFVSSIQADSIAVAEDPNGTRYLVIGQGGSIKRLIVNSDATGGISLTPTSTDGNLAAWWEGGAIGNDSGRVWKNFRYFRLVTDPPAKDAQFRMGFKLVDDELRTFQSPAVVPAARQNAWFGFTVDTKAKRCSPLIQFPNEDRSCHVMEMAAYYVPSGVR